MYYFLDEKEFNGFRINLFMVMIVCLDDDECWLINFCFYYCYNFLGRFVCFCFLGYVLGCDGWFCEDLDECCWNNGGCGFDWECLNI